MPVTVLDAGDTAMARICHSTQDMVFGLRASLGLVRKGILKGENRVSKGIEIKEKKRKEKAV